jgi:transposase
MPSLAPTAPQEQFAALEAALAAERAKVAELTQERDHLRASHERLRLELELLKRRIFIAKAERVDTRQLELDFATTLAALDKLAGMVPQTAQVAQAGGESGQADKPEPEPKPKKKPTGRRDLSKMPLEEERVEITDDVFEKLVAEGKAERIDFDVSYKLAFKRGGYRRLAIAKAIYRVVGKDGDSQVATALAPLECFPRSLAAPSALAHVLSEKFTDGMPLNRQESRAARDGAALDRGTMCRWVEEAGATAGATVVAAMREDAFKTAFCIATDATGISVQPQPRPDGAHQPCRRGHYFVLIADREHVFFEYTAKETSAFVEEMFAGYSGYVQADAKSVYDVLFREPEKPPPDGEEVDKRSEVGCLAHYLESVVIRGARAPDLGVRGLRHQITTRRSRTGAARFSGHEWKAADPASSG